MELPRPIAIVSALAEEQAGLKDQLVDAVCIRRAGRDFWCGTLHGHKVVLALSRIGKVAAATTVAALTEHFTISSLLFTGVAGGVGPGVAVGDVVVGSSFLQHDMDASPLFPKYEIPLTSQTVFTSDQAMTAALVQACEAALGQTRYGPYTPRIHHGLIASGDRFVNGVDEAARLVLEMAEQGHYALAIEMEGAAIAQVCHDYGIPFAAVRTVSDRADDTAHVDFPHFVSTVASVYALGIVRAWLPLHKVL